MPQFRDSWYASAPPWLREGNAEKYLFTLELMRDLLVEKADEARAIRLPGRGDLSQIPFLAHDRQLVQGPLEPTAAFIDRLVHAFDAWSRAGSARAVLEQLHIYLQGTQPGPGHQLAIVGNPAVATGIGVINAWWTVEIEDPIGQEPLLSTVPLNFNWDGSDRTWLRVLVLYPAPVATGQSGSGLATTGAPFGGSFTDPGHAVNGVWIPRTTGTPINTPYQTVTLDSSLTSANVGDWLTIVGSDVYQIVQVTSSSTCVIAAPNGITGAPTGDWSIERYPWFPPGLAWGSPGILWGDGETSPPTVDTGSNVRGVWQPTTLADPGARPSYSWGLRVDTLDVETIRGLLSTWKSAGTYYPNIVVCYDSDQGAFERTSAIGAGNPAANFGGLGRNVSGVWVPTEQLYSPLNCYMQGTGRAVACSVENIT